MCTEKTKSTATIACNIGIDITVNECIGSLLYSFQPCGLCLWIINQFLFFYCNDSRFVIDTSLFLYYLFCNVFMKFFYRFYYKLLFNMQVFNLVLNYRLFFK